MDNSDLREVGIELEFQLNHAVCERRECSGIGITRGLQKVHDEVVEVRRFVKRLERT